MDVLLALNGPGANKVLSLFMRHQECRSVPSSFSRIENSLDENTINLH
ncbi:hypothetical protein XBKB1_1060001 [Xenorhabdus bovienii str. kraussei Becker Underwood]|uniref:Uncharacterized protein n=1 Tax=Xenorhabdus bovienii str. kraussei Becker Underwood TaxID=1398204 RepID=A0A077PQV8_XENBV|nr:hypothetical protein XBKB1_1060001 [Xenorhabdus bovienii str. kraussei Becker Underwood]